MRVMFRDALSVNKDVLSIGLDHGTVVRMDDHSVHLASGGRQARIAVASPASANAVAEEISRLLASVDPPLLVEVFHDGRIEPGGGTELDIRRACLAVDIKAKREADEHWHAVVDERSAHKRRVNELTAELDVLRAKLDEALAEVGEIVEG